MKKQNKRGISLITLIVTIIVVIILAATVILTLTNNNPINSANKATFLNDLATFNDELNMYKAQQYSITKGAFDPTSLNANSSDPTPLYSCIPSLEGKDKYNGEIEIVSGKLIYVGEDKTKKTWAESINISTESSGSVAIVNTPVLAAGMIPIKWSGTTIVDTTESDMNWYSYTTTDKQWANARTADGSMWVWIPRYEYQITTPHSNTAQIINVNFLSGKSNTSTSGYTIHPAFTFGTEELTGIWVSKFEASGTSSAVDIKPDATSLRGISVDSMFTACRNMEKNSRYGWGTTGVGLDTHLIKNVEWGAVAYLSSSPYGKTGEVTINANASYLTGGGTSNAYATNVTQSTTGTIYGIYDMNGCSYEYIAAYVDNGHSYLTTYGNSLYTAGSQYKDVYVSGGDTSAGNYSATSSKKGDAIYETSSADTGTKSWYGDSSSMPYSNFPFFMRDSFNTGGSVAGPFSFFYNNGSGYTFYSFRTCLIVSGTL